MYLNHEDIKFLLHKNAAVSDAQMQHRLNSDFLINSKKVFLKLRRTAFFTFFCCVLLLLEYPSLTPLFFFLWSNAPTEIHSFPFIKLSWLRKYCPVFRHLISDVTGQADGSICVLDQGQRFPVSRKFASENIQSLLVQFKINMQIFLRVIFNRRKILSLSYERVSKNDSGQK